MTTVMEVINYSTNKMDY